MGIFPVHRNLLSNAKSQLKYLSSSSNLWFIRRISSPAGLSEAQSPALTGDLKSNNKQMLLIEHFHSEPGKEIYSDFPPYNYSLISAENLWKDHHNFCNPFSEFGNYTIAGSINEMMLIFFYNMDAPFTGCGKYLLWNPAIDKIKLLPAPGPTSINKHGFGFDSESEDYKVIRFPSYKSLNDCEKAIDNHFKLYSLKTNSWKKIMDTCCDESFPQPSFHVNGVCYWKTSKFTSAIIPSFDFANEKFSSAPHIPRPPRIVEQSKGSSIIGMEIYDFADDFVLVEFDGSLAALVHSELGETEEETFSFEVWGWNGESWLERKSRITIDVPGGVVKVLGLFQNDKLFLQCFNNGELMLFDLAKSKLENLGIRADPRMMNIFPFNVRSSIPFMGNK